MAYDKNHFELIGRVAGTRRVNREFILTIETIVAVQPKKRVRKIDVIIGKPRMAQLAGKTFEIGDTVGCSGTISQITPAGSDQPTIRLLATRIGLIAKSERSEPD